MKVTPITKEEAIRRIREGDHRDAQIGKREEEKDAILIQGLRMGRLEAALREDGTLAIREVHRRYGVRPGYRYN